MKVNIDDGLLDEVFEDLPGNSAARNQPAPRSPSKVGGQRQKMVKDKRWSKTKTNTKDEIITMTKTMYCIHSVYTSVAKTNQR